MIADTVYFCGTGKDCVKLCQAIFILKDIQMFLTVNKPIFEKIIWVSKVFASFKLISRLITL